MTVDQTANFVRGGVASSIASTDTTISVDDASIYPDPSNGNYNIVVWDSDQYRRPDLDPDVEIMRVTGRDTTNDNLTVSRGQENTSAAAHPASSEAQLSATSKVFTDIDTKIDSSVTITGSNGLSGGSAELGGSIDVGISGNLSLDSDLVAANGEVIWDESSSDIPQGRLQNDSMTIAGNSVSLGGSTAINHTNLSNVSSDDHHAKYTDSDAIGAINNDGDHGSTASHNYFSGSHTDLGNITSDDHHTRYSDEEAQDAVGGIINGGTDITANYDDAGNTITFSHNDTSTQGNVTTGGATVIDDVDLDGRGHVTNLNTQNRSLDDWADANGNINLNNNDILGINELVINDPGINEGLTYPGFQIYEDAADGDLVIRDETNGVDLIRQPKQGSTQFIQGADIGSIEAPEDSFTQIINASATSSAVSGDTVGYTFSVDNQTGFEVSATADGSGGLSDGPHATLGGDLLAVGGELIWDESSTHIPQARLQNDTVTVAGNAVSLGGSTSINHNDLSTISSDDHHTRYSDEEAQDAVGGILGANFTYDDPGNSITLSSDTVTVAGNSVALGGSTSINHNDLSTISSDDHHTKYTDGDAIGAINGDADHGSTASHNYFSGSHTDLSNITSDDHHTRYSDEEAQDAVGTIVNGGTDLTANYDDSGNTITFSHNDTSTQGNVSTGGATVIDDINVDGRGHVTNMNTENRTLDDWGNPNSQLDLDGNGINFDDPSNSNSASGAINLGFIDFQNEEWANGPQNASTMLYDASEGFLFNDTVRTSGEFIEGAAL